MTADQTSANRLETNATKPPRSSRKKLPKRAEKDGGAPFATRFRTARRQLTKTEARVGSFFLAHPEAAYSSITEVVEASGLGYGTIVRFCKKLGFAGFQDFKLCLAIDARDVERRPRTVRGDQRDTLFAKIHDDLNIAARMVSDDDVRVASEMIARANGVLIGGVASSAPVALSLQWKLTRLGVQAYATGDSYLLSVRAAMLGPDDVFVAISASGATKEIIRAASIAKAQGAPVIVISSFAKSPLTKHADLVLAHGSGHDPVDAEVPSTIPSEAVVEMLFRTLFEMEPDAIDKLRKGFKAVADRKL